MASSESEEENTFDPPYFNEDPSKEHLEKLYEEFIKARGKAKRKVGITHKFGEGSKSRYGKREQLRYLDEKSIFATAVSTEIARKIELAMMEILSKKGHLYERNDNVGGLSTKRANRDIYIYLTTAKGKEDMCPVCEEAYVETTIERVRHMKGKHFKFYLKMKQYRDEYIKKNVRTERSKESRQIIKSFFDWVGEPSALNVSSSSISESENELQPIHQQKTRRLASSSDEMISVVKSSSEEELKRPKRVKVRRISSSSDSDCSPPQKIVKPKKKNHRVKQATSTSSALKQENS